RGLAAEPAADVLGDRVGRHVEVLLELLDRGALAEGVDAEVEAFEAGDHAPGTGAAELEADQLEAGREDRGAIAGILRGESFDRGHRDHPRRDALPFELLRGLEREADLAAGGDDPEGGVLLIGEDVAALPDLLRIPVRGPLEGGDVLPREAERV